MEKLSPRVRVAPSCTWILVPFPICAVPLNIIEPYPFTTVLLFGSIIGTSWNPILIAANLYVVHFIFFTFILQFSAIQIGKCIACMNGR